MFFTDWWHGVSSCRLCDVTHCLTVGQEVRVLAVSVQSVVVEVMSCASLGTTSYRCMMNGGVTPWILNLGTSWRRVVGLMVQSLYLGGKRASKEALDVCRSWQYCMVFCILTGRLSLLRSPLDVVIIIIIIIIIITWRYSPTWALASCAILSLSWAFLLHPSIPISRRSSSTSSSHLTFGLPLFLLV